MSRPTPAERFDLVHGRELVGRLVVSARPGEGLSVRDRHLLGELCRPVALVVHAAVVRSELQESRQDLVTAREEERRKLRADLHDGLGSRAGRGRCSAWARCRTRCATIRRPPRRWCGALQDQVRGAVTQVRSLVEGLAPAVDQLGLQGALRQGAQRLAVDGSFDVAVDVPDHLPPLPAAVEVAAYRIAMEALTNVARHAGASRCSLRIDAGDDVRVEVTDDGVGLPATLTPGVGLSSMRHRAEELGGTWSIEPGVGGGTRVVRNAAGLMSDTATSSTTVVIADDHPVLRGGLRGAARLDR